MVKALKDLCLHCVELHLDCIPNVQHNLPTLYKEILIERLANHDLFHKNYWTHIRESLFCANLRYIDFYKCSQINNECLVALSKSKCKLEIITIHKCDNVKDAGVVALTTGQNEIKKLELRKMPQLTDQCLTQVVSPYLWKVDLRGCTSITNSGVATILKNNPSISHVNVINCSKIDKKIFFIVASILKSSLEEVETNLHTVTDEDLLHVADFCPNLKKLDLNGCTKVGKDSLVKLFQGCTQLECLDLSFCNRLRHPPESEVLWTLPQSLKELSLCGVLLEDERIFVECLQRLRSLTSLRLCGVPALSDQTLTQVLEHIGANLTQLDVSGGITQKLTDDMLVAVATHCLSLESLSLSLLSMPTGATLSPLLRDEHRSLQIKSLNLNCQKMELDVLFKMAAACHNLTQLDLSGLKCVTDDLLVELAHNCPQISFLSIKACRQVTDAGVCEVSRCCSLRKLIVSGLNNLTDKSIFALANSVPYLEEIYLNGCSKVTPMAVKYLTDCCIPRLYVQHRVPNAVPNQVMAKNLDTGEFCRVDLLTS